jgi:pyruvate dehydrogenase E2 component (dihydrolipoamide acetyltransferase)
MLGWKRNVELGEPLQLSRWRKISISSWKVTRDSSVVTMLELDVEPALRYLATLQSQTTEKLTLTHFAGYVLAQVFRLHPETNCLYRWGRLYPRKTIDICFLVASGKKGVEGKEDLSGHVVRETDRRGVIGIAEDLHPQSRVMKAGKDTTFKGIKASIGSFPHFIRAFLVASADFIMHALNLWSPILGFSQDAFGTAMLTSVGSLDIEFAIARIYPASRNVMMVSVGAVREKPIVRDGKVIVGKQLKIVFTGDHRIVDGLHAAYMLRDYKRFFEDPDSMTIAEKVAAMPLPADGVQSGLR